MVLLLSVLPGCAKQKPTKQGWASFPVAIYADSNIVNDAEASADLKDAMAFWEQKAGRRLFDFRGAWSSSSPPYSGSAAQPEAIFANVIFLQNPWPFSPTVAGQTILISNKSRFEGSLVMVNPNTPFCTGDCRGVNNRISELKVFTHELGHFLGLDHQSQDPSNIMYPTLNPGGSLEDVTVDVNALRALTL